MMFSSLTLAAVTSFLATAAIPQPTWQTDYAKARALSVELKKPVAVFLASDQASYITGQTIFADGGRLPLNYTVPVAEE